MHVTLNSMNAVLQLKIDVGDDPNSDAHSLHYSKSVQKPN